MNPGEGRLFKSNRYEQLKNSLVYENQIPTLSPLFAEMEAIAMIMFKVKMNFKFPEYRLLHVVLLVC